MSLYHILSFVKITIALIIFILLYIFIDPYADPLIALSGIMIGVFLLGWGISFFVFQGRYQYGLLFFQDTKKKQTHLTPNYSYRLSLLFGLYVLLNIIFILKEQWTILGGLVMLIGFLIIQNILLSSDHLK